MLAYAKLLNDLGVHVLVTDSLSPRGESELCTQRLGTRSVTQRERRRDALGALQWLAAHGKVDAARLGMLGWSNGGSAVLAANDLNHAEVKANPSPAHLAIAFYPGCVSWETTGYVALAPLTMMLGGADDWTPPKPCEALASLANKAAAGAPIKAITFEGAYHGFDGTAAVRLRKDVPNGERPGQGVHVGGNVQARKASQLVLERVVLERWFAR